jgi:hypothetical protein
MGNTTRVPMTDALEQMDQAEHPSQKDRLAARLEAAKEEGREGPRPPDPEPAARRRTAARPAKAPVDARQALAKLRERVTMQVGVRISSRMHVRLKLFVARNAAYHLDFRTERQVIEHVLGPFLDEYDTPERFALYEGGEDEAA